MSAGYNEFAENIEEEKWKNKLLNKTNYDQGAVLVRPTRNI